MMIYYSGAGSYLAPQSDPAKSLGGYSSNSVLPNGTLGNLFSPLTKDALSQTECKLIVLRNITGVSASAISIYVENESEYIEYKIAAVAPTVDECGKPIFELLAQANQIPYQASLAIRTATNPINAGNLAAGKEIGIWIQRTLKPLTSDSNSTLKQLHNAKLACDEAVSLDDVSGELTDSSNLIISWT